MQVAQPPKPAPKVDSEADFPVDRESEVPADTRVPSSADTSEPTQLTATVKHRSPRRARRQALIAATTMIVAAGLVLIGASVWQLLTPSEAPTTERRVVAAASDLPNAAAAQPLSVQIPAIGFDAKVREFSADGAPSLVPPDAEHIYWLEEYGLPGTGSDNTVYLIGHTSADGRAVFDPLVDRAAQQSTVLPGDEIRVENESGLVSYEVVAVERHNRQNLAEIENVWANVPGRLVLITCFFEAQSDTVSDNLVVFARARE